MPVSCLAGEPSIFHDLNVTRLPLEFPKVDSVIILIIMLCAVFVVLSIDLPASLNR